MSTVSNLTFILSTGPTLDNVGSKTMRAHTTRANFARRRRRLVIEHNERKKFIADRPNLHAADDSLAVDDGKNVESQLATFTGKPLQDLDGQDSFFISYCA